MPSPKGVSKECHRATDHHYDIDSVNQYLYSPLSFKMLLHYRKGCLLNYRFNLSHYWDVQQCRLSVSNIIGKYYITNSLLYYWL